MKGKFNTRFLLVVLFTAAFALTSTGCAKKSGKMSAEDEAALSDIGFQVHQNGNFGDSISSPSPTPIAGSVSPTPSPSPFTSTTYDSSGVAPVIYPISAVGYTAVTITVSTKNTLKLQFQPDQNSVAVAGTAFHPNYSKLAVFMKVGTTEQATTLLSNGLDGTPKAKSTVIDMTNAYTRTCPATDTNCRESVTITIYKPNYDYYQYNFGIYCFAPQDAAPYCSDHTRVYDTHQWGGTLFVQTSDTRAL